MNKSYYAIIPANVRYDEELTPNAKLLYGEITALCNEKGYCWASNGYFAELYKVSKVSVSKWINQLIDKGYITSEMIYKEGTKEIEKRHLYIGCDPIKEKFNTYKTKVNEGIKENLNTPIKEKFKDNNTVINNTFNSMYVYTDKLKDFIKLFNENIISTPISKMIEDDLSKFSEIIEVGLFRRAIEIATDKGKCNWGYVKGILKKWLSDDITTLEKLRVYEINNSKKSAGTNMDNNKKIIPKVRVRSNKFNEGTNNNFTKYTPEELEKLLQESQKGKFNREN